MEDLVHLDEEHWCVGENQTKLLRKENWDENGNSKVSMRVI
jgi:hypothetical protein